MLISQTASIIAQHKPRKRQVVVHEGLRDRYYGLLEGGEWNEALGVPHDAESQERYISLLHLPRSDQTDVPLKLDCSTPILAIYTD
jgi:hypothetical protein